MHIVTMPKRESMTITIEAGAIRYRGPKQRKQVFADRRTKRQRTRNAQRSNALRDS